ncbi:MAG TPA: hypothetical protein VN660_00405 [Steroidobacteraceae bacterium]|nr:hypothetical protein [Steroidobacteraceae bacterium]
MSHRYLVGLLSLAMAGPWAASALAQPPADLNPAVNTSVALPSAADPPANSVAAAAAAASTTPAAPTPALAPATAAASHAAPAQPGATPAKDAPAPATTSATAASSDRIELGTTEISGNRELPKLMYIVPWQRAAVGKITGRPPNSLVDEALSPVDRSVFERQNSYYAALQAASASAASQPAVPGAPPAAVALRDEK